MAGLACAPLGAGCCLRAFLQVNKISTLGTPLQIAAVTHQKDVLELLLEAGANPNIAATSPGSVPPALILAASKGASDIVQLLLQFGADPDAADSEGFTPLHCAAEANCASSVQFLLKSGADWGAIARVGNLFETLS